MQYRCYTDFRPLEVLPSRQRLGFELGANIGQLTVHHLRQPQASSTVTAQRHQRRDSKVQHLQL